MSLYDYEESKRIAAQDYSFKALIMAAVRQANTSNNAVLREAFPSIHHELVSRYNAPGGLLPGERTPSSLENDDSFDDTLTGASSAEDDSDLPF